MTYYVPITPGDTPLYQALNFTRSARMTDSEICRACAEANGGGWNHLTNAEQAMLLIEQFKPTISWDGIWTVAIWYEGKKGQALYVDRRDQDLKRAVATCVAAMWKEKTK